jgi:hypothetical protein
MSLLVVLGIASMLFVVVFTLRAYRNNAPTGQGQSRRESIVEAWVNITIGFSINFVANLLVFPLVDAHITLWQNWWMGWVFTTVSIVRQYAIRRWFNDRLHKFIKKVAHG